MGDIPMGWATLIAAILTSCGGVVAIIMSVRTRSDVKQIGSDARIVREQVKNSHPTNMRDENDERHVEVMNELRTIKSTQATHGRQIGDLQTTTRGMKRDIGRLADADQEQVREDHRLGERLSHLERKPKHNQGDTNV
jgi:hypothetical protein